MTDRHTNKIAQTELPLKSPADQACLCPVAAVTALFTNNLPGAALRCRPLHTLCSTFERSPYGFHAKPRYRPLVCQYG